MPARTRNCDAAYDGGRARRQCNIVKAGKRMPGNRAGVVARHCLAIEIRCRQRHPARNAAGPGHCRRAASARISPRSRAALRQGPSPPAVRAVPLPPVFLRIPGCRPAATNIRHTARATCAPARPRIPAARALTRPSQALMKVLSFACGPFGDYLEWSGGQHVRQVFTDGKPAGSCGSAWAGRARGISAALQHRADAADTRRGEWPGGKPGWRTGPLGAGAFLGEGAARVHPAAQRAQRDGGAKARFPQCHAPSPRACSGIGLL